jgi:hypothetical protein
MQEIFEISSLEEGLVWQLFPYKILVASSKTGIHHLLQPEAASCPCANAMRLPQRKSGEGGRILCPQSWQGDLKTPGNILKHYKLDKHRLPGSREWNLKRVQRAGCCYFDYVWIEKLYRLCVTTRGCTSVNKVSSAFVCLCECMYAVMYVGMNETRSPKTSHEAFFWGHIYYMWILNYHNLFPAYTKLNTERSHLIIPPVNYLHTAFYNTNQVASFKTEFLVQWLLFVRLSPVVAFWVVSFIRAFPP